MRIVALNPGRKRRKKKNPVGKKHRLTVYTVGKKLKASKNKRARIRPGTTINPKKGAVKMARRKKRRKNAAKRHRKSAAKVIIMKNPSRRRKHRRSNPKRHHRRRKNPSLKRSLNLKGILAELKPMLIGAGGAIAFNYAFNYIIKKTSLDSKYFPYIKLALAVALPKLIKGKMGITASLVVGALTIKEILEDQFPSLAMAGYDPSLGFTQYRASTPAVGFTQYRAASPAVGAFEGQEWRDFA